MKRDQAGNRSFKEVQRLIAREVEPVLGQRQIDAIRKADLIQLVDAIVDRGAPVIANRVLAHTKRLFAWAAARDLIETDPSAHIEKPSPEVKRDRVLSDAELVEIWRALEGMASPYVAGVRLLILTGARRAEVFEASWPELAGDTLQLPAERAKAKEGRVIPLSPPALAIVNALPRFAIEDDAASGEPRVPWLLTLDGKHPYSNCGHAKATLDRRILDATRTSAEGSTGPMAQWRLHDIRRTVATGLQRLGIRLEAIETVLGHVSGSRAGIVGVYQKHRFEAEAREALAAWAAHLQRLLDDDSSSAEVVPLRRA